MGIKGGPLLCSKADKQGMRFLAQVIIKDSDKR